MDKRPEPRHAAEILVRVWGMDADGRPFFQNAQAGNISTDGALLSGIAHPLKAGDVIGVQHGEHKARFRVVWVADAGGFHKIDAGVKIVQGQQSPWQGLAQSSTAPEPTGKNRRRFARHKVLFPIEITLDDSRRSHQQTHATDIGGRGCYVETLMPLPIGTNVNLMFWIDSEKVRTTGKVRTSDPGVGMGVEFTTLDDHVQERLQHFLQKLDTGFANREAAKQGG
jgi:hypothetical protein